LIEFGFKSLAVQFKIRINMERKLIPEALKMDREGQNGNNRNEKD